MVRGKWLGETTKEKFLKKRRERKGSRFSLRIIMGFKL